MPTCTDVEFAPGAFTDLTERRDVLAVGGGGFANVLGSTRRGTLLVDQTASGLKIGLTNAQTDTARRVIEAGAVADIYVRPLIDLEASEYTDEGTTRVFTLAVTRALLIKPTPEQQRSPSSPHTGRTDPSEAPSMAVTITAADLAAEIGVDQPRAERLLTVATQIVGDYAPDAPEAIANEAVIRFTGYLGQSDYGAIQSERLGPQQADYVTNHAAAFRYCGAAGLLTRYKRRRAGAI